MARKIVKAETHRGKIGMIMTALAVIGAFSLFKNRRRKPTLMSKLTKTAAALVAAREVLGQRANAQIHVRPTRLGAWLAR